MPESWQNHSSKIIERSLEVKLPTIWKDGKAEVGRVRQEKVRRRAEKRKNQKTEDAGAQNGRKIAKPFYRQCFVAPQGRKVGLLKRVWSHLARGEMKTCTALWCEADFEVKMQKTPQHRSTLGS